MNILDKTRLLQTSILSSLIMGLGSVAYAQVEQVPAEVDEEFEEAETIVVTGSRIRRPDLDTIFPTTVVDNEQFEKSAFTNIADALIEIPAFGATQDSFGAQGENVGANFVDFLDLGPQRTLTLVNGRRFVAADTTGLGLSVDFNVIPTALVERIETIGVGGAPVYGSDAIAGTVNVILKDDFEGLEATALYGETERGDADRRQFQIVAGANSGDGKANVTFSAEYFSQDGIFQLDRPEIFSDRNTPFISEVPAGTAGFEDIDVDGDGDPDSVFRPQNLNGGEGLIVQLVTNGGLVSAGQTTLPSIGVGAFPDGSFFEFNPSGELIPFETGGVIPGQSLFFASGGSGDEFFAQTSQISSPVERINFGSSVKYDINDNITFKADGQFANTKTASLVQQGNLGTFQTFAFGGLARGIEFGGDNPFLTTQAQDVLAGVGVGPDDTFVLSRFNFDLAGGNRRESETNIWRISAGLEGDFEFADREFYWDAYGVAGQSSNDRDDTAIFDNIRFLNALEAVTVTDAERDLIIANGGTVLDGNIACQVTRDFANGADPATLRGVASGSGLTENLIENVTQCVPVNLFGEGSPDQGAIDFIVQRGVLSSDIEQRVWAANFGGQLVELPAGWASFSVGYEARQEAGNFAASAALATGAGRDGAVADTGGSYSTDEFSGELLIPIVSPDLDIPLVHNLEAEGAVRRIKNSLPGAGEFTAWTVGGTYAPIPDISIRGNITQSLRTPSITELFQPIVTLTDFGADPCDMRNIEDEPNRRANCLTAGVPVDQPGGFTSNAVNAAIVGTTGGNPDLDNEKADAFTIGAVIQPRFIPGLTLQGDYIQIDIEDRIGAVTLDQNLETCFDADPADFPNAACSTFQRDANSQLVSFQSGNLNADLADNQFLNFRADYDYDLTDALNLFGQNISKDTGQVSLGANLFHVIQRDLVIAGVEQDNTIGGFFDPEWSGTFDTTYTKDGFRLFWRTIWQEGSLFSASGDNTFADENGNIVNRSSQRFIHNASVSYDVSELTDAYDKPVVVQLNVDNVFNRKAGTGTNFLFNDFDRAEIFGRQFTFRVRAAF